MLGLDLRYLQDTSVLGCYCVAGPVFLSGVIYSPLFVRAVMTWSRDSLRLLEILCCLLLQRYLTLLCISAGTDTGKDYFQQGFASP